jgi:hypothetical protein
MIGKIVHRAVRSAAGAKRRRDGGRVAAARRAVLRAPTAIAVGLMMPIVLGGCATHPLGPSVMVMPAPNKPFEVFAQDQALCRSFADQQVNGGAATANNQAIGSAVVGTALGAGLGAAIGGGGGAAIGAASGAVLGTGVGANSSSYANFDIQQRYDIAYVQCMYARGNQVPGYYQPAPAYYAPPPPPNEPPPPVAPH